MQIIIDTPETTVSVKNKCFFISNKDQQAQISPKRITSFAITSNCNLHSSAIKLAAVNQVPLLFFNRYGSIEARLWSPYFVNIASLRRKQLVFYNTPAATNWLIENLLLKTQLQALNIQRLGKQKPSFANKVNDYNLAVESLKAKMMGYNGIPINTCRNNLLGLEGNMANQYWKLLALFLPGPYFFEKRTRQPGLDFFNTALNYLYGMTYSVVESGVFTTGFDPFAGFLHTGNYNKKSLVFDLIEPVRPLIDRLLIQLCFEGLLNKQHFIAKAPGFWLSKEGKKIIIPAFNQYLYSRVEVGGKIRRVKDHIYEFSISLARTIRENIKTEEDDLPAIL